ncbi:hypothetical protein Y032_0120g946 [Ancylostoma ceylanicum]|nr:hypothetical protein Y032_0120g946 [Ancylostoma ceylanicum]
MGDEENSIKFAKVVRDCVKTSSEAVENVEKFLAALKNTGKDLEGISLLDVKNREMISYMAELSLLMSHISCGKSISEHPAVFRASKHRTILERIRPIEQKMKSQIDRLTQGIHNGEVKAPPRARPDQMEFDDDSESEEDEVGKEEEEKKTKKYVPPKMMAVRYEEEENEKETKAVERAKRRALQSSLVQELRQQYSDAPEEFREKSRRKYEADKERERFEEDHFVRLRMSKAEKKRERLQNRDNAIDDLFNFGNYMMRDESGEALSNSKKRLNCFPFLYPALVRLKAAPTEILDSELRETRVAVAATPAFQLPDAPVNAIAMGGLTKFMRGMRTIHRVSWRDARTPHGGALVCAFETWKASRTGGPRGKKSRFDRKKSQKLKAKSKHKAIKRRQ